MIPPTPEELEASRPRRISHWSWIFFPLVIGFVFASIAIIIIREETGGDTIYGILHSVSRCDGGDNFYVLIVNETTNESVSAYSRMDNCLLFQEHIGWKTMVILRAEEGARRINHWYFLQNMTGR